MEKKARTVDIMKQQRKVPASVLEGRKEFSLNRKALTAALMEGPKTIPQLAGETKLSLSDTTYFLMAMFKFGEVAVHSMDDMDEYYLYELKNK